ncbi:cytochrome b/b6 domain-containing protein [Ideonella sp. 4Y11]|uniref:Cytochrome b/b6 domain-containing protein n=1 Tax=Ideonella aquatica TaxID=2824119 RepID=A0A940YGS3_9BURK|nr:cytochrome b/b6 domain-containing protein [Ideonella aquatica]MBQ0957544.1 cytochrome b/b6 domain-containing protein [Ideonella aquatica]
MATDTTAVVQVPVWDRFVRIFHWGLVASFATAWLNTEHIGWWHKGAGYLALALVLARIVWGFVAPGEHARFGSFVPTPRRLWRYLGQLLRHQEPRHLGHNPAGAVMILYLLAANLVIGATGFMMTTDAFWGNELVESVHVSAVDLTLLAVAVHVAANLYGGRRHGEHLVRSMWTGRKPLSPAGHGAPADPLPGATGDRQQALHRR